ncbi:MAG: helix-turn-helix domain-containing protein [Planctomycetota bacterium]
MIRRALAKFNGNKSRTAQYLGMSRGALRNRIEQL